MSPCRNKLPRFSPHAVIFPMGLEEGNCLVAAFDRRTVVHTCPSPVADLHAFVFDFAQKKRDILQPRANARTAECPVVYFYLPIAELRPSDVRRSRSLHPHDDAPYGDDPKPVPEVPAWPDCLLPCCNRQSPGRELHAPCAIAQPTASADPPLHDPPDAFHHRWPPPSIRGWPHRCHELHLSLAHLALHRSDVAKARARIANQKAHACNADG